MTIQLSGFAYTGNHINGASQRDGTAALAQALRVDEDDAFDLVDGMRRGETRQVGHKTVRCVSRRSRSDGFGCEWAMTLEVQ